MNILSSDYLEITITHNAYYHQHQNKKYVYNDTDLVTTNNHQNRRREFLKVFK